MNIELLYLKLPLVLKKLAINLQGFALNKQRYDDTFKTYLKLLEEYDADETESLDEKLLRETVTQNKYYNTYLNNLPKNWTITDLPVINKRIIKENFDLIREQSFEFTSFKTSGTSGSGLKYPVSKEFISKQWAVFWKFRKIHGLALNSWSASFTGRTLIDPTRKKPPYGIMSYSSKQLLLSQYHLSPQTISWYISSMRKSKIQWLHGYPSTLALLASLAKKEGLSKELMNLSLKVITTSSEKLLPHQRLLIESSFHCKVRELYGMTEGVANFFECEEGALHVDETYSYVEFLPQQHSEEFRIVGTLFSNQAFPLIRYDTGDTALLAPENYRCPCGRKSRVVEEVMGRQEDYLFLKNGNAVGRLDHLLKGLMNITEAQIVQKRAGEATIFLVVNDAFNKNDEQKIRENVVSRLGKDFSYKLNYVSSIDRTKSGKLKFVINHLGTPNGNVQ